MGEGCWIQLAEIKGQCLSLVNRHFKRPKCYITPMCTTWRHEEENLLDQSFLLEVLGDEEEFHTPVALLPEKESRVFWLGLKGTV